MKPDIGLVNFQWAIRLLLRENKRYEEKKQSGRSKPVSNRTHVASVRDASRGKRTLDPLGISLVTSRWTAGAIGETCSLYGKSGLQTERCLLPAFTRKGSASGERWN